MNPSLESLDSVYFEFNDRNPPGDTTVRPTRDAILRRVFSQRPLDEQALLSGRADLARLLAVGQEEERRCRQCGDLVGLPCCLGNLGLLHKAQGDWQGALEFHRQEADLCRQLGDTHGLIGSLLRQARLLAEHLNEAPAALALAEEAHRLATQPNRTSLASQTEAILATLRQGKPN